MTGTHYRHRFARTFRTLARQHPDLSLQQLFRLCQQQLLQDRITELLTEAHRLSTRYHLTIIRSIDAPQGAIPYRRQTQERINTLLAQAAALSVRRDRSAPRIGHQPAVDQRIADGPEFLVT